MGGKFSAHALLFYFGAGAQAFSAPASEAWVFFSQSSRLGLFSDLHFCIAFLPSSAATFMHSICEASRAADVAVVTTSAAAMKMSIIRFIYCLLCENIHLWILGMFVQSRQVNLAAVAQLHERKFRDGYL
jgi:hypothetical protein